MTTASDPDGARMLRVKRGDLRAFEELVDQYKQPVTNLVYRMIGDLHEAEDLCQNVFVQVFRSARRYRHRAKFTTWLFTIARNLCLNELRRRSRHRAESLDAERPEGGNERVHQAVDRRERSPTDLTLEGELEAMIQSALAKLPENQRLALLLCRDQDRSYEEIAQIVGCSLSATKSLIYRGRETLKKQLKPYLRDGTAAGR